MKLRRTFAFILTLALLLGVLPLYAFSAFEAPAIEVVQEQLTGENEGLVYDTDFEGLIVTPAGSVGDQNATSTISGFTATTGKYFSAATLRDFWVNDGYRNLYSDSHSIIWRAHEKAFVAPTSGKNDDNNNFDINLKSQPAGESFVISLDLAMLADGFTRDFNFFAYCNNATSQIKTTFLTVQKSGTVVASGTTVGKLAKGEGANFTIHVRIVPPSENDSTDKGSVRYDVYRDGVLAAEDLYFVSPTDQVKISKVDRGNSAVSSAENNTGLSTDYKLTYVRLLHTNGATYALDENSQSLGANGADLISLGAVRMYYSDVCYEVASTVEKVSLGYEDNGYSLAFRLMPSDDFLNDEGAKIRFTAPSGKVTEALVSDVSADELGKYVFEFSAGADDYDGDFKLELIASDGTVSPLYENGKPVDSYIDSIKALEAELYDFSAILMPVYGARKAIVSLTFDDAVYPSALVVEELCEKYGMKASMMMWCSRIGLSGSDYADKETWAKLFAKGYLEPQSHSMTHMDLRTSTDAGTANQSDANFKNEIVDSKTLLEEMFPDFDFLTYAIPFGSMSAAAAAYANSTYYASRGVSSGAVQTLDPAFGTGNGTWGKLYSPTVVKKDSDGNVVSAEEQLTHLKGWVDRTVAEGGWYVPFIHKVGDVSGTEMTYAVIDEYFAYIDKYQESGDVWVATFSDAVKYVRERQNTTAAVRYEAGNVYVTLTMADTTGDGLALSPDVFNHPLTVKVEVPESFSSVCYKLGGEYKTASTFTEGESTYAYVDIVPDGGEVEVHGTHKFTEYEKIDENTHRKTCYCGFVATEAHTDGGCGYCMQCELDITGISLSIDYDLAMKFHVSVYDESVIDGKDFAMRFTMNGKVFTVTKYVKNGEVYVFAFDGIGPHQIGLGITADVLIDGTVAEEKSNYSVENYCREVLLLHNDDETLVNLVNSLLIYGAAADEYRSGVESSIGSGMELVPSEFTPSESDNEMSITGNESSALFVYSAGVRFDTADKIFFKIYSEAESFTVEIYDEKSGSTVSYEKAELEDAGGGFYFAYSLPVHPSEYDHDGFQRITLKDADGVTVSEVVYTVNTYAYYMLSSDSTADNMKALALALYRYGKAAEAYVAARS